MQHRPMNWYALLDEATRYHESSFSRRVAELKAQMKFKSSVGIMDGCLLHTLVKWYRPEVIVETGTYYGMSSAFFIQAFKEFGIENGRVYTIDIDQSRDISALHSQEDQERYLVRLEGDAFELGIQGAYPAEVDLFFHDSVHRYDWQMREFDHFWPRLRPGGILTSHDVNKNAAFVDFLSKRFAHDAGGYASGSEHGFFGMIGSTGFISRALPEG